MRTSFLIRERVAEGTRKINAAFSLVDLYFVAAKCHRAVHTHFVVANGRTNGNWFDFVRLIAATTLCRKNSPCHARRIAAMTCPCNMPPATCRIVSLRL